MDRAPAVAAVRNPHQLVIGWLHYVEQLSTMGIAITYVAMPSEELGDLDTDAGELRVRADADPVAQFLLLQRTVNRLVIGPHAAPSGKVQPALRLVPQPRTPDDPAA